MSRIGNMLITLPKGVELTISKENEVVVKGPKGTLNNVFSPLMDIKLTDGVVQIVRANNLKHTRELHGTTRSLINGMVEGVTNGFKKELKIQGIGYRCVLNGTTLVLSVGYSHKIDVEPMDGIVFSLNSPTEIVVEGIDKQKVGEMAAIIRSYRKPEPYGGKGILYKGENIRRKVGKKAGKK